MALRHPPRSRTWGPFGPLRKPSSHHPHDAFLFDVSVALVLDLRAARRVRKTGMIPPGGVFRTQVVWLFIYLAFSLLLLAGCLLRSERLLAIGLAALGLAAVGFTLTCTTVLYFMHGSLAHPLRTAEARPDWDATADEFSGRLERLIRESAPYRSEELTLPQLARALGVEPRRLLTTSRRDAARTSAATSTIFGFEPFAGTCSKALIPRSSTSRSRMASTPRAVSTCCS